jgi:acetoin utilization protein AcuB
MKANNAIVQNLPLIYLHDSVEHIRQVMAETHFKQIPVVDKELCLGIISESDIADLSNQLLLVDVKERIKKYFLFANEHLLEAIKKISFLKIQLMPVVDEQERYLGSATAEKLLYLWNDDTSIKDAGSILILEVERKDFSMSSLCGLIEEMQVGVIYCSVNHVTEAETMEVTLKVNTSDLTPVIGILEQHHYIIKNFFNESNYLEDIKERYSGLMNYLKI